MRSSYVLKYILNRKHKVSLAHAELYCKLDNLCNLYLLYLTGALMER
jgi:hypothetical protein